MRAARPQAVVPDYLGRVLDPDGEPAGTCFQVASEVIVTAAHVLVDLGVDNPGSVVSIDPLGGGQRRQAQVVGINELADLAVLTRLRHWEPASSAWWPPTAWP